MSSVPPRSGTSGKDGYDSAEEILKKNLQGNVEDQILNLMSF